MQKFSQKYTLIQPLEAINEGDEYASSNWPLHVTIADTFAVNWSNGNLLEQLSVILASREPFTATAGDDTFFGPAEETQVTLLDINPELMKLHLDVVSLLKSSGAVFNDPQFTEDGFKPHATVQLHARLDKGDEVPFSKLAIIDMFPNGDPYTRKVIKIMKFTN